MARAEWTSRDHEQQEASPEFAREGAAIWNEQPTVVRLDPASVYRDPATMVRLAVGIDDPAERGRIAELAESIREHGQMQPILVRNRMWADVDGRDRYSVIAGRRRLEACTVAGVQVVAYVRYDLADDDDAYRAAVAENQKRRDFSPIELLGIIEDVRFRKGWEGANHTADVARWLGWSDTQIRQIERLRGLPANVREQLHRGEISKDQAYAWLSVEPAARPAVARALDASPWEDDGVNGDGGDDGMDDLAQGSPRTHPPGATAPSTPPSRAKSNHGVPDARGKDHISSGKPPSADQKRADRRVGDGKGPMGVGPSSKQIIATARSMDALSTTKALDVSEYRSFFKQLADLACPEDGEEGFEYPAGMCEFASYIAGDDFAKGRKGSRGHAVGLWRAMAARVVAGVTK